MDHAARSLLEILAPFVPSLGDRLQHLSKRRHAEARLVWKVGATVEGSAYGRKPHAEGPAASSGKRVDGVHVDGVKIRTLLAVDFDTHEALAKNLGDLGVGERLSFHDMAPVTSRVPDAQEDGLVLAGGFLKRLFSPRIPIHRVVGVLEQVGTGLLCQPVRQVRSFAGGRSAGRPDLDTRVSYSHLPFRPILYSGPGGPGAIMGSLVEDPARCFRRRRCPGLLVGERTVSGGTWAP